MANLQDLFDKFQPREILTDLISADYFEFIFPFLLLYALFYTVLSYEKIKFFRNKLLNKPAVVIVSFVISFYAIKFETSNGQSVATLLQMLFPNISTLTVLLLGLYVVGSMFGKDFFKQMFDKKTNSFNFIIIGTLGLGSIVYYVGIAMGAWSTDPHNFTALYNTTLAIAIGVLGITFLLVRLVPIGLILLTVLSSFLVDGAEKFILSYFIDPFVFMLSIIVFLLSWMGTSTEKKEELRLNLLDQKETVEGYHSRNDGKPLEQNKSRLYDISSQNFEENKKKWEKEYPGESWEK